MIDSCFSISSVENAKIAIAVISLLFSVSLLTLLKKLQLSTKSKIVAIYAHLITLFFPIILLTTNVGCYAICASCYANIYQLLSLALPTTLLASAVAGFLAIPALFAFSSRKNQIKEGRIINFVQASSKKMKIGQPKVYILNKSNPIAFSFRNFKSAIFLSVGLFEIMKWKELQAIILHELAHIKQKSSALKLSTFFLRIFSPLSIVLKFHHNNIKEEKDADGLAIKIQGTDKHIKSARKKIQEYTRIDNAHLDRHSAKRL